MLLDPLVCKSMVCRYIIQKVESVVVGFFVGIWVGDCAARISIQRKARVLLFT